MLWRFSLVTESGGYPWLWCLGFSLPWLLLLQSTGSRAQRLYFHNLKITTVNIQIACYFFKCIFIHTDMGFRTWLRLYVIHKVWHPAMDCFLEIKINLSVYVITNLPHQNLSQIHLISKANKEILLNNLHLKERKRERERLRETETTVLPQGFLICSFQDTICTYPFWIEVLFSCFPIKWDHSLTERERHQPKVVEPDPLGYCEVKVAQSCPTLCDPMDNTVHGILQDRILEWVAFPFSRASFNPGIKPRSSTLQADSLLAEPQGKPPLEY